MAKRLKAKDYIKAIEGSGGNISEIARRLNCHRDTVSSAIKRLKSVTDAYEIEREAIADEAEFGITHNINVLNKEARDNNKPISTGDHKWWLARVRPQEFGDKLDITSGNKPLLEIDEDKIAGYIERLEELATILADNNRVHSSEQTTE